VYGNADAASVRELRRFRDERLLSSSLGRGFVRLYYATSPPVAQWLRAHPRWSRFVRLQLLDRLVAGIRSRRV
jgi:hypothetical protein